MTLPLTPTVLAAAYDFLCATQPFSAWNLPDSEEIRFRIVRSPSLRGWYTRENGKHVIAISSRCVGRTQSLVETLAHEICHLHEDRAGMLTCAEHSAAFLKLAARVCKFHGFDEALF